MVGSVDAADIVQEASIKAIEAIAQATTAIADPEAWLFRVAHNAALDALRQHARQPRFGEEEDLARVADPANEAHQREAAAAGLHVFMRLPVAQRGILILKDVLGYSLKEIVTIEGGRTCAPLWRRAARKSGAVISATTQKPTTGISSSVSSIENLR